MNARTLLALVALVALVGCATNPQIDSRLGRDEAPPTGYRVSGIIGITEVNADLEVDPSFGEVVKDDRLSVPTIGAAWQLPVLGDRLEFGVESGFTYGWENERRAVIVNDGSLTIFADNSTRLFDLSVGAYASTYLGERVRLYGGVGPLLQYASVDLDLDQSIDGRGSLEDDGFGYGYYARVGVEYQVRPGMGVGFVGRMANSRVDLSSPLGNFDQEAIQVGLVLTAGF